jgi:hypothetical protein
MSEIPARESTNAMLLTALECEGLKASAGQD